MRSNKTHPQRRSFDASSMGSTVTMLSRKEKDCCEDCGKCKCCTVRCVCISVFVFLGLGFLAMVLVLAILFGIPPRTPENRICKTANNRTGFLCDDRATCVLPSAVCNGVSNCYNSEDENPQMCSNLPKNLPAFLIFQCANPLVWIYSNQECDGYNNCGDCSDEAGSLCGSSCPAGWKPCTPVFYQFCQCIPPTFRCDGVQHCNDWSDERDCSP
ncbi:low-density lipoprotein receptor class A domain-containing protein 1-like [Polypterus senegalus]|uniref:low-density lipoprotein receptor class A domain-containing protein 1-like n=1 Tax=Polypterus senegalus TaxID=55291 RepID=UPI0019662987|nr:low-density lipoprotein receptor class A domain-containing protein 1-like [Polypterus senegalus]